MGVELICVLPHGGITLNKDIDTNETNIAFDSISKKIKEKEIENVIIFDPHDTTVASSDRIKVIFNVSDEYHGKFKSKDKTIIEVSFKKDTEVSAILNKLSSNSREIKIKKDKYHELSWATTIPMYHIRNNNFKKITVAKITSSASKDDIEKITTKIIDELNKFDLRTCIILSCDLSHCHSKSNKLYKFNKSAKKFDDEIVKLTQESKLDLYKYIPDNIIKSARTCCNKNFIFLSKATSRYSLTSTFLSYEKPTYFGMLVSYSEFDEFNILNKYCFDYIKKICYFKGKFPRKNNINKFISNIFIPRWGFYDRKFTSYFCRILFDKIQRKIGNFDFQLCGLETGSIPMLTAIPIYFGQYGVHINSFVVRKKRRDYGLQNIFDGTPNNKPIVMVDDIINSFSTTNRCKQILLDEGYSNILDFKISVICANPKPENIYLYTFKDFY
jgi:aromatic ring-opening dioxygenase LigB subunit